MAFNAMAAELAERTDALHQSDRLRRQMLADVSHELRTPLTAMRGYVETLRREELDLEPAVRSRYFETLERETHRLERIVMDLLDLARLENGVGAMDVRVFALARLFDHVVHRHEHELSHRGIQVQVQIGDAADQITGDPHRLEQVVENLFANALRHVPAGGRIDCRAYADDGQYVVAITDSGGGIAPEHLPHVFERFYRVDTSRSRVGGGSGLGLTISKAIVERHGGQLDVTSEPGRTTFSIRLPRQAEDVRDAQSASTNR
jgi:two-component system phosphate regulon sensor histidine kinase PhoR